MLPTRPRELPATPPRLALPAPSTRRRTTRTTTSIWFLLQHSSPHCCQNAGRCVDFLLLRSVSDRSHHPPFPPRSPRRHSAPSILRAFYCRHRRRNHRRRRHCMLRLHLHRASRPCWWRRNHSNPDLCPPLHRLQSSSGLPRRRHHKQRRSRPRERNCHHNRRPPCTTMTLFPRPFRPSPPPPPLLLRLLLPQRRQRCAGEERRCLQIHYYRHHHRCHRHPPR
mmetsp:Transcript_74634/g.141325  ORF Transcript_74634/g.141325 Transcript_74634/m.141325 type:complete len:223 (-) Transcript_74634:549-1217(-)